MRKQNLTFRLVLALAVLLCVLLADSLQACPTCKESLSENNKEMIQGYFWSIMFMMAMPFSILTGISTYFYLLVRKNRKTGGKSSGV
tara:strand:+ start:6956 stop:7216 length:261 start_codon:yes stop_codon:yes gene_type:complete